MKTKLTLLVIAATVLAVRAGDDQKTEENKQPIIKKYQDAEAHAQAFRDAWQPHPKVKAILPALDRVKVMKITHTCSLFGGLDQVKDDQLLAEIIHDIGDQCRLIEPSVTDKQVAKIVGLGQGVLRDSLAGNNH